MGERWQAKYGRKKKQATKSPVWLAKYGQRYGLFSVADKFNPNQPRDWRGRWSRIGGGAGERMSLTEVEGRYDKLANLSRLTPEKEAEFNVVANRLAIQNYRELYETEVLIRLDDQPISEHHADELNRRGFTPEVIAEIKSEAARLEQKYGEPVEINLASTPPGTNFDGWVKAGEGGSGDLTININKDSKSNYQRNDLNYKKENSFPAGNRRLHFNADKYGERLASEGFDLKDFLGKNPDYAAKVRFTVQGNPPTGNLVEGLKTVIRHEYGHVIHLSAGKRRLDEINKIVSGISMSRKWLISDYAQTNNGETFAEAFAMYENHPALAKEVLPGPLLNYIQSLHGG